MNAYFCMNSTVFESSWLYLVYLVVGTRYKVLGTKYNVQVQCTSAHTVPITYCTVHVVHTVHIVLILCTVYSVHTSQYIVYILHILFILYIHLVLCVFMHRSTIKSLFWRRVAIFKGSGYTYIYIYRYTHVYTHICKYLQI